MTNGVITSGGGFSVHDPLPDWQKQHVDAFFASTTGTSQQPVSGFGEDTQIFHYLPHTTKFCR
jgi:hypothetical protein